MDNPEVLAREAREVLDHPAFLRAELLAKQALLGRWALSEEPSEREALWYAINRAHDEIRRQLKITVQRGKEEKS